jgi:hypothetical protein
MAPLKTLKALPKKGVVVAEDPPKLEAEQPHMRLSRLTSEQVRLVEELQSHKQEWASRNRVAQDTHQPPSTPEIQAFKQHHRDLSSRLAAVNLEIGQVNREIRQHKAEVQARKANGAPEAVKTEPLKQSKDWLVYFKLAAENELDAKLIKQIERVAKSMAEHARINGVD